MFYLSSCPAGCDCGDAAPAGTDRIIRKNGRKRNTEIIKISGDGKKAGRRQPKPDKGSDPEKSTGSAKEDGND
jgi:hypothetical protein